MNLIETVNGQLPLDKEAMLAKLDSYLTLPERERLIYRLCRRMGRCREPRDVDRLGLRGDMEKNIQRIEQAGQDPDAVVNELADSMV